MCSTTVPQGIGAAVVGLQVSFVALPPLLLSVSIVAREGQVISG